MERIAGPGATPDNFFTEGDPSLGIDATTVTANWLNGVQEELIHILEEGGITPDVATLTQVLEALRTLFIRKDVPENMVARNLLTISALTGSLPANGVFPWASLFVSESTETQTGSADNTLMIAANAYWDGTKWKRRASGSSVGIQFKPEAYTIQMMWGGYGDPGDVILWTPRGEWTLNNQAVISGLDRVATRIISPVVNEITWTSLIPGVTSTVKSKKMPDNTLHIYGKIDKVAGGSVGTGTPLLGITGDPFEIGAGKTIAGIGFETQTPLGFNIKYDSSANETQLAYYDLWDSAEHSLYIGQVVPCLGV